MTYELTTPRIRGLAGQPLLRPRAYDMNLGWGDFDIQWALSVSDASDRVALEKLANANPGKHVVLPLGNMGFIPHERA